MKARLIVTAALALAATSCGTNSTALGISPVAAPDLIVTGAIYSPDPASLGDVVTFTATIKNQGGTDAKPFDIYFELGYRHFPWPLKPFGPCNYDYVFYTSGLETAATGLSSGATQNVTISFTLPKETDPRPPGCDYPSDETWEGNWVLTVFVDPNDPDDDVDEDNTSGPAAAEGNNEFQLPFTVSFTDS